MRALVRTCAILIVASFLCTQIPLTFGSTPVGFHYDTSIDGEDIIRQGICEIRSRYPSMVTLRMSFFIPLLCQKLEQWLSGHPSVDFASFAENTITVRFVDGSYTLIIDPFYSFHNIWESPIQSGDTDCSPTSTLQTYPTALVLNPTAYMYGTRHCRKITSLLQHRGYSIVYTEMKQLI